MNSQKLYQQVRAGFIVKHTTLNAFCVANDIDTSNATRALKGKSNGPTAKALVRRLAKAAGVKIKKHSKPEKTHD
jgi:hypothetical protein